MFTTSPCETPSEANRGLLSLPLARKAKITPINKKIEHPNAVKHPIRFFFLFSAALTGSIGGFLPFDC